MNFLSELQGLSGENLCSATLRLLVIRSQDLRERLIDLISQKNKIGPIVAGSHFSCTTEEPTEDSGRRGRLDLFLEMSDAVVGIENKLYAGFQDGQPHKYLKAVLHRAEGLASIRNTYHQGFVAVLAPENRENEIKKIIGNDERFLSLSWEEVLKSFKNSIKSLDLETRVLFNALDSYIKQETSLFPDWTRWTPHLRRRFEHGGTPLQRTVVGKVWHFFPDSGKRLSAGDTYCGYYFTEGSMEIKGWFGFISKKQVSAGGGNNEVEFIIATSFHVPFDEKTLQHIELKIGPKFLGAKDIHTWAIDLDDTWGKPDSWIKLLRPLLETYEGIRNDNPTAVDNQRLCSDGH